MTVVRPDLAPLREDPEEGVKQFPGLQPWHTRGMAQQSATFAAHATIAREAIGVGPSGERGTWSRTRSRW